VITQILTGKMPTQGAVFDQHRYTRSSLENAGGALLDVRQGCGWGSARREKDMRCSALTQRIAGERATAMQIQGRVLLLREQ